MADMPPEHLAERSPPARMRARRAWVAGGLPQGGQAAIEVAFRPPPTVGELTQARAPKRRRTISAWSLSAAMCKDVHPRHESST